MEKERGSTESLSYVSDDDDVEEVERRVSLGDEGDLKYDAHSRHQRDSPNTDVRDNFLRREGITVTRTEYSENEGSHKCLPDGNQGCKN